MSGIYINGLEMPKETYAHCMLVKDIDGSVQLHVCTKNSADLSEWEFYDLIPVPSHGKLIDADALKVSLAFAEKTAEWAVPALRAVLMIIDEMPTIIPADPCKEKGE